LPVPKTRIKIKVDPHVIQRDFFPETSLPRCITVFRRAWPIIAVQHQT
jgi:hypothetical protein